MYVSLSKCMCRSGSLCGMSFERFSGLSSVSPTYLLVDYIWFYEFVTRHELHVKFRNTYRKKSPQVYYVHNWGFCIPTNNIQAKRCAVRIYIGMAFFHDRLVCTEQIIIIICMHVFTYILTHNTSVKEENEYLLVH